MDEMHPEQVPGIIEEANAFFDVPAVVNQADYQINTDEVRSDDPAIVEEIIEQIR